jgi:hypothetical protein
MPASAKIRRKTWAEKMNPGRPAEVKKIDKDFADIPAGSTMLIATPQIVADYIGHIPKGKTTNIKQIRKDLAGEYHADYTCPVTTGIFLRIAAEAAYEEYKAGKPLKEITPFWRVISENSPTIKKLSFPVDFVIKKRKEEGIS